MTALRVLAALLGTICLIGCQPTPTTPTPVTPTTAASTIAPTTPSPTTPTPEPEPTFEGEKQAIYKGLKEFLDVWDRVATDPKSIKPGDIGSVSEGTAALNLRESLATRLKNDWKTVGVKTRSSFNVNDPVEENGVRVATVTYCTDRRGIGLATLDGIPKESPKLSPYLRETTELQQMPDKSWTVVRASNVGAESC